jgi:hypothetical protein
MKPLLDELRDIAKKRNKSVAQVSHLLIIDISNLCYVWLYDHDRIIVAIMGV